MPSEPVEIDPSDHADPAVPGGRGAAWLHAIGLLPADRPLLHRVGLAAWAAIGIVVLVGITVVGLAAVSSVVLPLLFAVVLAVVFRPVAARLERRGVHRSLAAGAVVLGLVLLCAGVVGLTVHGVISQSDRIIDEVEAALAELDLGDDVIADARAALEDLDPSVTSGFAKAIASGLSAAAAFAVGALLGTLIMYYVIRDGAALRRALVRRAPPEQAVNLDDFISETCYVLRRYWLGRTIVSAIVASVVGVAALALDLPLVPTIMVVTFVGGFIPYVGAVAGGALSVVVALGTGGLGAGIVMLVVVLVANLLIENLVEPAVTGRTLQIHPLVVLIATTVGGIVGGLAGLVMAVPLTVIAAKAIPRIARLLDVDTDDLRESLTTADE